LNSGFQINEASLEEYLVNPKLKLILICSPNNPTGNLIDSSVIERIASSFNGIVLIDEAYIEFSESNSCIGLLSIYPNLIISQTFSKARGLAAARIGLAYSNPNIINLLNRVKPPYNVSTLNQQAAIEAIGDLDKFEKNKAQILKNKKILSDALNQVSIVEKVYPSEANFFLIKTRNANAVYNALVQQKIIIRNRNNVIENCLRITVGTKQENNSLVEALKLM
ncbi:MAG: aminotransferase class I/II-fold pyridoxal phosphate-dependent enzyme, partial [Crocinitomicaceae bacterium]|nr:aminotransferase class I/II-fold pyridoxal phosphate-dependent enzyme [Crocinitomicaceae bacterium]